ncbi:hypothetical protein R3P38DRAFT_3214173 [Favolaschia claudopus]|uniref:Uncharacterized protein n=1 Tax=Favolaschia claudopus TaxID=2862362 RepID=A0AAW0AB58_9AGAR
MVDAESERESSYVLPVGRDEEGGFVTQFVNLDKLGSDECARELERYGLEIPSSLAEKKESLRQFSQNRQTWSRGPGQSHVGSQSSANVPFYMELYLHRRAQYGLKLDSDPTKPPSHIHPTMHGADWAEEIMQLYPYRSLDKVAGKLDCQARVTPEPPEPPNVGRQTAQDLPPSEPQYVGTPSSGPVTRYTNTTYVTHEPIPFDPRYFQNAPYAAPGSVPQVVSQCRTPQYSWQTPHALEEGLVNSIEVNRGIDRHPFTVVPPPAAFPAPTTTGLRKQRKDSKSQKDKENLLPPGTVGSYSTGERGSVHEVLARILESYDDNLPSWNPAKALLSISKHNQNWSIPFNRWGDLPWDKKSSDSLRRKRSEIKIMVEHHQKLYGVERLYDIASSAKNDQKDQAWTKAWKDLQGRNKRKSPSSPTKNQDKSKRQR